MLSPYLSEPASSSSRVLDPLHVQWGKAFCANVPVPMTSRGNLLADCAETLENQSALLLIFFSSFFFLLLQSKSLNEEKLEGKYNWLVAAKCS